MAANDLNSPLHREAPRVRRRRPPVFASMLVLAGALLALAAALWVAVVDDPDGGRAVAVAAIQDAQPAATGSLAAGNRTGAAEVPHPAADDAQDNPQLAALMPMLGAAIPDLIEQSAYGPLPRVSPDGRRPREAYARRSPPVAAGTPRVALVISGMGLSQTGTQSAIAALPQDVTLAFAPYGSSLQRWVDKARADGHEVLLQVPLEPEGYPDQDPGEHTLLVSTDHHANDQNLEWVLSRMTSYAGVMNYMGARFTSDDHAMMPFLGEVGERGLYYLDDGSSPQSHSDVVGEALQVPVVKADRILDQGRSAGEIGRELDALEAIARTRGIAVGVASAFPTSVETIAKWAREAPARGIVIVPASAALGS
jgi:polysaccharide deacetylase 2 family uncharacterized protein YibQ